MKIIVGLGNPGLRYRNTRHNAGFLVIDELAKRHRIRVNKKAYGGLCGTGRINGVEILLFKPLTYMNLSGSAVSAVVSEKLQEKEDLLVVSDDIALTLGNIRLRTKGSSGGQNGLRSIIDRLGEDFARLRIGIGTDKEIMDSSSFVLGPFTRKERPLLAEALENAAGCVETWLTEGVLEAMSRYNG